MRGNEMAMEEKATIVGGLVFFGVMAIGALIVIACVAYQFWK